MRVAIIGGGLAGMSAAEHLARLSQSSSNEVSITLFESKRTTGGRAGSFESKQGGSVDYCQHVAMGCCHEFINLMDRIGLTESFERYRELQFRYPGHAPIRFAASRWLPPPLHLLPTFARMSYLSLIDRFWIAVAMRRLVQLPGDAQSTAGQWLRSNRQSQASIERFWEVVVISALGETIDRVSTQAMRKVFVDGFLASRDASDVWVPNRPLSKLFGDVFPARLSDLGVNIRANEPVKQISTKSESEVRIDTAWHTDMVFDRVIMAVPWYRLARLLEGPGDSNLDALAKSANSIPASPITGIHLWFDRPWMEQPHAVMVGTLCQWIFNDPIEISPKNLSPPSGAYCQVVISASRSDVLGERSDVIQRVIAEIHAEFPESRNAKLIRSKVVTDPSSVFSVTPEVEDKRPLTRTSHPSILLAGDWVQTGWPATMEGAVISGRLAAEACVDGVA
ncbi:MAG: hydroxysqualene dehydroxylase HpnE [Planctomycetota bacterium]